MKINKILAAILALTILVGCFALPVGAASVTDVIYENNPKAEDKIATMESVFKNDDYELFYQSYTGEIAIKNLKTGEYTFSNPCDLEVIEATKYDPSSGEHTKTAALLSQIIVKYTDKNTGTGKYLGSFDSAAVLGNQIEMMRIDGGIRVEYALGSVESKRLVPMWIEKSRFEEKIYDVIRKAVGGEDKEVGSYGVIVNHLKSVYYREVNYATASEADKATYLKQYPILQTNPDLVFYVLADTGALSLAKVEELVKAYCPEYTFDELEADHTTTGYEGDSIEPPLFRLAVEYTFNKDGFSATVPAKSIRYNETNYSLDEIVILPYFGCTTTTEIANAEATKTKTTTDGYLFLPDGSGTLLEYYNKDGSVKTGVQNIYVYGTDFAYENLDQAGKTANSKVCRVPVFGLTEYYDITTQTVRSGLDNYVSSTSHRQGFVAVITAGDSLAKITASLGQLLWNGLSASMSTYNAVYVAFSMQQTDTVSLGSALGGGTSMSQSVDTRYIGDYSIQYMLLTDNENFGEPTYSGMATAYRNYLINTGAIAALGTSADATLPLYIQTLGSMKVSDEFLTFPITVTRALTSFENIKSMTETLADAEYPITNVKYILSGYANGTASSSKYPTSVKFGSQVGGKKGFVDLIEYAIEKDIEVMPNFDFANVSRTNWGFSLKKHGALMMSDRYATKRSYDAVYQTISRRGFANLVSTTAYNYIFEKFSKSYDKFFESFEDVGYSGSLAALTLGTDLNSDFNKDNPITREESKQNTVDLLANLAEHYDSVVVEGGNAYTIPYANAILSVPLDNSNYAISSAAIPFIGMVLHGYKNYAGDPLNMSGDVQYAILKSIENGAAPYYFLVYDHATDLRTSKELSKYYSADFSSWFAKPTDASVTDTSIQTTYKTLNEALGGLQNATITAHGFHTAFKLDANEAAVLFGEYNAAVKALAAAKEAYQTAAKATESNKYSGRLADYISAERAAKAAYTAAQEKLDNVEALIERNNVGGVVSVTYTEGTTSKTFYINYNNFNVVFECEDGKVYEIAPMKFVTEETVVAGGQTFTVNAAEDAENAYLATTAKIIADFTVANETLANAKSEYEIKRALSAINVAIEDAAKAGTGEVVTIDYAGDSVIYINYTSGNVIVKISDTRYELIPAQSYLIVE